MCVCLKERGSLKFSAGRMMVGLVVSCHKTGMGTLYGWKGQKGMSSNWSVYVVCWTFAGELLGSQLTFFQTLPSSNIPLSYMSLA